MTAPVTEIHDENTLRGGIRPLVFPRSLAIVGASERNLRPIEGAHAGGRDVVLVNPNRAEIAGRPCVPVDRGRPFRPRAGAAARLARRASWTLSARRSPQASDRSSSRASAPRRARTGRRSSPSWVRSLDEAGAASVGPNCMGVACPGGPSTWIGTVPDTFLPGHVAVVVQSGSVGDAFIACGPRIGFRCVVSSGGEASRDAADLLAFLAEDDGTQAIGLFLETVRRPGAFAGSPRRGPPRGGEARRLPQGRALGGRGARDARPHGRPGRLGPGLLGAPPPRRSDRGGRTSTTCSRRSKSSDAAAARRHAGRGSLRVGRGMCAPRRPGRRGRASRSSRCRTRGAALRAEFPNFVAPGNPARRVGDRRRDASSIRARSRCSQSPGPTTSCSRRSTSPGSGALTRESGAR